MIFFQLEIWNPLKCNLDNQIVELDSMFLGQGYIILEEATIQLVLDSLKGVVCGGILRTSWKRYSPLMVRCTRINNKVTKILLG